MLFGMVVRVVTAPICGVVGFATTRDPPRGCSDNAARSTTPCAHLQNTICHNDPRSSLQPRLMERWSECMINGCEDSGFGRQVGAEERERCVETRLVAPGGL